jgi:hypothetical protein
MSISDWNDCREIYILKVRIAQEERQSIDQALKSCLIDTSNIYSQALPVANEAHKPGGEEVYRLAKKVDVSLRRSKNNR